MRICNLVNNFSFGPFRGLCGISKWRYSCGSCTPAQRHTKTHTSFNAEEDGNKYMDISLYR